MIKLLSRLACRHLTGLICDVRRHPINQALTIHTDSMFVLHRVNGLLMPLGCAAPVLVLRLLVRHLLPRLGEHGCREIC